MLPNVARCSLISARSSKTICSSVRKYSFDPLEAKMAQKRAEVQQKQLEAAGENVNVEKTNLNYSTKQDFHNQNLDTRFQGASSETGQVPTFWQQRFLVITKLYPNIRSIPPYVHNGTMNRMHDRMRVVFIVVACCFFFIIFFTAESNMAKKITRDREAGVVVTKL